MDGITAAVDAVWKRVMMACHQPCTSWIIEDGVTICGHCREVAPALAWTSLKEELHAALTEAQEKRSFWGMISERLEENPELYPKAQALYDFYDGQTDLIVSAMKGIR
jgi:hypothetical protein